MYESALEIIGISGNEAKVYEALLTLGEATASTIAQKSGIHRRSVYDILERLVEKGLAFKVFQFKDHIYRPVDPQKCMEIIKEREGVFSKVLPKLKQLYQGDTYQEAAFIYKGLEGYKNYVRDLTHIAEDTYYLGTKGNWYKDERTMQLRKNYLAEMQRKNKKIQVLFDPRAKSILPHIKDTIGGPYKFLPEGFETPGIVDVFGDYVVTFNSAGIGNFGEDGSIFVMINRELAESYRTWFKLLWKLIG